MNYALCGSTLIAIPLVLFTKEKYVRSDLDDPSDISQGQSISTNPFDNDEDHDAVFRSSNVPYSVMQYYNRNVFIRIKLFPKIGRYQFF